MATLKFGTIVTAASGKVGGHFFSNGQGGPVLCTNGRSLGKRQTSKKLWGYIKMAAYSNSQGWGDLTDAQRMAWEAEAANWNTFNKVGDAKSLRGYGLYMLVNGVLSSIGAPSLLIPGVKVFITQIATVTVNALSTLLFTVTPSSQNGMNEYLVIEATRTMGQANKPANKDYRIVDVLTGVTIYPHSIYTKYKAIFGAPLTNGYINVRCYMVNITTGQRSIKVETRQFVS